MNYFVKPACADIADGCHLSFPTHFPAHPSSGYQHNLQQQYSIPPLRNGVIHVLVMSVPAVQTSLFVKY
jgi:hypothetical protein